MISPKKYVSSANMIQRVFLSGVLLGLALVMLGWFLVPASNILSIASTSLILIIYSLVGYLGFPRIRPEILKLVGVFGLLAGLIFASEILLEYAVLPKDNTNWGVIEFGAVFAVYFILGLVVAYRQKSIRPGILAAVVSAMLSSVIWFIFILLTFYLFRGTARQEAVFMTEGNYADFARSGMSDFNTFVMEDFLGAGFFHLLLAPFFATILGTIGSLFGNGIAQSKKN